MSFILVIKLLVKQNRRVNVSRTDPFFLLGTSLLLLNFFWGHLPSTPTAIIVLGQPSSPVLWLSAMLTIATTISLISVFHIWLCYSFVRIPMQRIATELYPTAVTKFSLMKAVC